jgi:hypothetical protein|tara:strand:- start:8070 stop:9095 length:1026 start_codon:yes stop_codon:yes gene_type:complete
MATLSGNKVKDTYQSLLKLETNGLSSTPKIVEDGAGVDSALKLSTTFVEVNGTLKFTTAPSTDSSELTALLLDGSNNIVKRELDATAFSSGAVNTFQTIAVSGQTSVVADSSTDTLTLAEGAGIDITTNASTDTVTIANSSSAFKTISVSGQTDVVADAVEDTLTLAAGTGITITTAASTDTITIASSSGTGTPIMVVRPSANYTLTSSAAIPNTASVSNTSDTGTYSINNPSSSELELIANKGVKVAQDGVIRIDVDFILETTSANTDVEISIIRERPEGASETVLQQVERRMANAANVVVGFSLYAAAIVDDVYLYKIHRSAGAGSLKAASSFTVTKLS